MIRETNPKHVAIEDLGLPGDFAKRLKSERVLCHLMPPSGHVAPCGALIRPTLPGRRGDAMSGNPALIDCPACHELVPGQRRLPEAAAIDVVDVGNPYAASLVARAEVFAQVLKRCRPLPRAVRSRLFRERDRLWVRLIDFYEIHPEAA